MEIHTHASLDKLSFRELQQVVKSFNMVAQGNRDELSARILEAQSALPATPTETIEVADDVVPSDLTVTDAPPADAVTTERQVELTAPPAEIEVEVVAAPVEKVAPAKIQNVAARAVSAAAKRHAGQMISGDLSGENYGKDVEQSVVTALERGEQPCIVKGEGNTKFELKIFTKIFNKADLSSDVSRADGALVNVSRRLADANLLPYT